MIINTNYMMQFGKISYDCSSVAGSTNEKIDIRKAYAIRNNQAKEKELNILMGKINRKCNAFHKEINRDNKELVYNNYSATGVYVDSINKSGTIIDNSGPCTANTSVDALIDVGDYIQRVQEHNENSIQNAGDSFIAYNKDSMEGIQDAYHAALIEKYTYLKNEALKHNEPMQYIYEKYHNPDSSYYASDLTESQRNIAYSCERDMLKFGTVRGVHYDDSLFGGANIFRAANDADEKIFNRRMVNKQLSNMLNNEKISIPSNVSLICTVDSVTCRISIGDNTGDNVDRSTLINRIENAINNGNNGLELYMHIRNSCNSLYKNESSQYSDEGWYKFNYLHNVENSSLGMDDDYNEKFVEWMQENIRYIATGKHTKSNYNFRYVTMKECGYRSLVNEYYKHNRET